MYTYVCACVRACDRMYAYKDKLTVGVEGYLMFRTGFIEFAVGHRQATARMRKANW